MANPKAAIYVRVSTADQNVETQLLALREYAERMEYEIVQEFVDDGISGTLKSRPALDAMMHAVKEQKFGVVLCYKLDRIARSLQNLLGILTELEQNQCKFVSITESGIDTTTPMGKMICQILGAVAEFERNVIVERVTSGVHRAKMEGKKLGRPKGKKDGKERKRSGYWLRWAGKQKMTV